MIDNEIRAKREILRAQFNLLGAEIESIGKDTFDGSIRVDRAKQAHDLIRNAYAEAKRIIYSK